MATFPVSVFQSSPTSGSTPAPSPTPVPTLTFAPVPDTIVCTPARIAWSFIGSLQNLTIAASNYNPADPSSLPADADITFADVVDDIDPNSLSYLWDPVDVVPGQYILAATALASNGLGSFGIVASTSAPFQVVFGNNTSCLVGVPAPSSSADGSSTPTSSSASADQTLVPVGAASKSTSSIVGPVVGGIIGGVALVILVVTAWLFYLRRKSPRRGASSNPFTGGKSGRWNGLSSRDSGINHILPTNTADAKPRDSGHVAPESAAGIMSAHNSTFGHSLEATSPLGSEEDDLSTLAEEKSIKHSTLDHIDTIPALTYNASRRTSVASRSPPPRARSTNENRPMALDTLEQPSRSRYSANRQSLDGRVLSSTGEFASAASPTSPTFYPSPSELLPMGRSTSTGQGRRAARKPVPNYTSGGGDSSTADSFDHGMYSAASSDGNNSNTASSVNISPPSAQRSREELPVPGLDFPVPALALHHKSSFGDGRPMHYLIPDMPAPQRE